MNAQKICFITCVNDPAEYAECERFLQALEIPDGFTIETLPIEGAPSMTAGYNFAMQSSDAKYKVYLHQDVRIIHKRFLFEMIEIFQHRQDLGMLGVAGGATLPADAVWWNGDELYGKVYDSHTNKMQLLEFQPVIGSYQPVQAIDGLIMMTQYDLRWREDVFTGWHFYDLSQCMEFLKHGYKVGVPAQGAPWCLHNSGVANINNGYEVYRNLFIQEYQDFLLALSPVVKSQPQTNTNEHERTENGLTGAYEDKQDTYYQHANPFLLSKVNPSAKLVLDIGCGEGNLGAAIKHKYGCQVYGVEYFPAAAEQAREKLDHVVCGNIESDPLPYEHELFDQIIFGDVLEHLVSPWDVLKKVMPYLKPDGTILTSIPNVGHSTILVSLLAGKWTYQSAGLLDKTHLRFFTAHEIVKLFTETGYEITDFQSVVVNNDSLEAIIQALDNVRSHFGLGTELFTEQAQAYQYVVEAKKGNESL